jgi:hypothetical protein
MPDDVIMCHLVIISSLAKMLAEIIQEIFQSKSGTTVYQYWLLTDDHTSDNSMPYGLCA